MLIYKTLPWLPALLLRSLAMFCFISVGLALVSRPAYAADAYVTYYLKVTEPISLALDAQGQTRLFSAEDISEGKKLFGSSCTNCHVGGSTLPNPPISLSLDALNGATPPRNTVSALVEYLRHPMSYDGTEDEIYCREIPESWLSQPQVENLAGFILRAAQVAPGWGTDQF
ncbi:photosystem II cytochrome PsbV2 [Myxacorys almedinensis]|uniref:Photosystem II cytochrome PsbV2 n=1 Tax=Myxacorys almedinensis A TaxID=2690445 RepID=A0A8J7YZV5_9CYAN|nr:photosystem II cytochrome PsbV2 [Myxacorys almedinensis]NDJ17124.1 photosystem II cytochrome PsbV2 [Myxacorys almedinensis A]